MNKYKFLVIGNRWANIINEKLINLSFQTNFLQFKNINNNNEKKISNLLKKKKFDYCWVAINPKKNYKIIKLLLLNKVNLILEKPIYLSQYQFSILNKIRIKNKLVIIVNFQYIFLNKLKKYKGNPLSVGLIFNSQKSSKRKAIDELGSHLMAIKLFYFKKSVIKYLKASFNYKEDERKVIIYEKNYNKYINLFDGISEDILSKIIKYAIDVLNKKKKNQLSFYFGFRVKNNLIKYTEKNV